MPQVHLVEKFELFETTNPALAQINAFTKNLGPIDAKFEADFLKNLDRIVDRVADHFERRNA